MRPVVDAVIATIKANHIDVVVVDPFVKSHRVSENDNNAIDAVATLWAEIADVTNCAIELLHHPRKHGGADITIEDGRGASSLISASRSARVLNRMTKEDARRPASRWIKRGVTSEWTTEKPRWPRSPSEPIGTNSCRPSLRTATKSASSLIGNGRTPSMASPQTTCGLPRRRLARAAHGAPTSALKCGSATRSRRRSGSIPEGSRPPEDQGDARDLDEQRHVYRGRR